MGGLGFSVLLQALAGTSVRAEKGLGHPALPLKVFVVVLTFCTVVIEVLKGDLWGSYEVSQALYRLLWGFVRL